ncbi:SCP-like protein [Catonella morbi ATCC 51271]|uniref:SCP-like protein n=2 Tax=Catonella TaxID=43996 RepID=V2Z7B7_9FIRM|nr:SCP-like protein [Catonella morbi ATCC 51271]
MYTESEKMNGNEENMKRFFVNKRTALIFSAMFLLASIISILELKDDIKADNGTGTIGLSVDYRSPEDIRNYIANYGTEEDADVVYDEKPMDTKPYSLGKLSKGTLESALKLLNQMRYIAGIPYDVELSGRYNELAQAASVVSLANGDIDHNPKMPKGISDSLYRLGKDGASKSNLGMGYRSINSSLISYMEDGGYNKDRVGHRRWILNPAMKKTGFGFATDSKSYGYTAHYALDSSGSSKYNSPIVWPAQNMPVEYVNDSYPWSISLGYEINISDIHVELVRISDNKTWKFSSASSDGYFTVDNRGYGQKGCIIFIPNMGYNDGRAEYMDGDKFRVTVKGLKHKLSYQVSFFNLHPKDVSYKTKANNKNKLSYNGKKVKFNSDTKNENIKTAKQQKFGKKTVFLSRNNKRIFSVNMKNKCKYILMYSSGKDMAKFKIINLNIKTPVIKQLKPGKTYYVKLCAVKSSKIKWGKVRKIVVK